MESDTENSQKIVKISPGVAIAIGFQLLFLIFAGITIGSILSQKNEVAQIGVQGYSEHPEQNNENEKIKVVNMDSSLDGSKKTAINGVLYKIASLNNDVGISNRDGKIREGSAYSVYIEDLDLHFLNFIVDIEDLAQSYRIVYRWADKYPNKNVPTDDPVMAFCLDKDELIYGDFDCKDNYGGRGKDLVVYGVLRYKLFNNYTVGLLSDVLGGEALKFRINTSSDSSDAKEDATNAVSSYLASLGFDINDFDYVVGKYACCYVEYEP